MSDTAAIEISNKLTAQYRKRILKKVEKQQGPIKTLVWRSSMSAIMILAEIQDIPFEKLTASLYFLCNDLQTKELTRKYESLLELAGAAPDRFVDCLHKELNALSIFIKENHLLPELFEMISIADRVRYTYHKDNPQAICIFNAYKDLVLQTLEYLRPSKFDFDSVVCGCSSHGEILTTPEYYARIDSISYEVCKTIQSKNGGVSLSEYNALFESVSAKCGYPEIKTWEHLDEISRIDRLLTDQRSSLCTYINEYTYDMVPKPDTAFNGQFDFLLYIFMLGTDMNQIEELLKKTKKDLAF